MEKGTGARCGGALTPALVLAFGAVDVTSSAGETAARRKELADIKNIKFFLIPNE